MSPDVLEGLILLSIVSTDSFVELPPVIYNPGFKVHE